MNEKRKEFGRWIQTIREEAGLTKMGAATALGYKSFGTIHTVEQGVTPLPVERIHPICRLYKLDVDKMVGMIEKCEPELFTKYKKLQNDFFQHFATKLANATKQGKGVDFALHHNNFPNQLNLFESNMVTHHDRNESYNNIPYRTPEAFFFCFLDLLNL